MAIVGAIAVLFFSAFVLAIPTRPDPCSMTATWQLIAFGNPDLICHQHNNADDLRGVVAIFKGYSVWDDKNYRYNGAGNGRLVNFGHGFIQRDVYFNFIAGDDGNLPAPFPVWAMPLILNKVRDVWEIGVNANAGLKRTRIRFVNAEPADFSIKFAKTYPVGGGPAPPENDFPDYNMIGTNGTIPSPPPPPPGGAPWGGREGVLGYWAPAQKLMVFNSKLLPPGLWYKDDTGIAADDINPAIQGDKFDFVTTALHEWGHMLGLDHPDGNPVAANIMTGAAQSARMGGIPVGINRAIGADSIRGAKNLYTIWGYGDMNCDGIIDVVDVPGFVAVLLGLPFANCNNLRADVNCDGASNGKDIPGFIRAMLELPPVANNP